jgi:hypothetical protein
MVVLQTIEDVQTSSSSRKKKLNTCFYTIDATKSIIFYRIIVAVEVLFDQQNSKNNYLLEYTKNKPHILFTKNQIHCHVIYNLFFFLFTVHEL